MYGIHIIFTSKSPINDANTCGICRWHINITNTYGTSLWIIQIFIVHILQMLKFVHMVFMVYDFFFHICKWFTYQWGYSS
jgi:hypothetical protein